ncbi:MAG: class I SAM-dependent methyltransferase [Chthoniobacterales bacterium]
MNPSELRAAWARGENLMALLRKQCGLEINTEEFIELSYDLRAGVDIDDMEDPVLAQYVRDSASAIARLLHQYGQPTSLLEAGVGEATTLSHVLKYYKGGRLNVHGFDLCWSRIYLAKQWLAQAGLTGVSLCTGTLTAIPFADNSFDVVYTAESVGENSEREADILAELYRVASRYVILLEPAFELAKPEAQARMLQLGYCRDLCGHAQRLGMKVLEYKLVIDNPENPIGSIVIEKDPGRPPAAPEYRCPKYHAPLVRHQTIYYSSDSFTVYPVVAEIPCLRPENAITATLYASQLATERSD